MSTFARLTLIGLYKHEPQLFDYLTLPDAYNRDTFVETLLLDHGEKRVAYPEPDFFKYAVGVWSRKWSQSLERIATALTEEYNPTHNYDRYEKWTDKEKGKYKDSKQNSGNDVTQNTGNVTTTETGTSTETTNNMVTERNVSAFNESGYQPDEKNTVNGSVTRSPNTTETVTPNTTETVTHGLTENESGDNERDAVHDGHLYGNIGVTSAMSLVAEELALRTNNNLYAIAAELFADDMLLMLY